MAILKGFIFLVLCALGALLISLIFDRTVDAIKAHYAFRFVAFTLGALIGEVFVSKEEFKEKLKEK